jgi:hypothetical protein
LKSFVFGVLLAIFQSTSLCFEVYRVQAGESTPSSLGRPDRSHKGSISNVSLHGSSRGEFAHNAIHTGPNPSATLNREENRSQSVCRQLG